MSANSVATADHLRGERIFRDWLLFMLTVLSGAVDAISFLALGKVLTALPSVIDPNITVLKIERPRPRTQLRRAT